MSHATTPFSLTSDRAKEALLAYYERAMKSSRVPIITVTKLKNIIMLEYIVGAKEERRFFVNGADVETFSYWLTRDERFPLVKKMLIEGMKPKRIATVLMISSSTVYSDRREMVRIGYISSDQAGLQNTAVLIPAAPLLVRAAKQAAQAAGTLH